MTARSKRQILTSAGSCRTRHSLCRANRTAREGGGAAAGGRIPPGPGCPGIGRRRRHSTRPARIGRSAAGSPGRPAALGPPAKARSRRLARRAAAPGTAEQRPPPPQPQQPRAARCPRLGSVLLCAGRAARSARRTGAPAPLVPAPLPPPAAGRSAWPEPPPAPLPAPAPPRPARRSPARPPRGPARRAPAARSRAALCCRARLLAAAPGAANGARAALPGLRGPPGSRRRRAASGAAAPRAADPSRVPPAAPRPGSLRPGARSEPPRGRHSPPGFRGRLPLARPRWKGRRRMRNPRLPAGHAQRPVPAAPSPGSPSGRETKGIC